MKKQWVPLLLTGLFIIAACAPVTKVPITNRKQRLIYTQGDMNALSFTSYSDFLSKNPALPANDPQVVLVRKVGGKIQKAVEEFMTADGKADWIKDYKWEFNVVNAGEVNAWCMPGGKVMVYTGLLPVTQDEEGLAVVMGHEIAHAIAQHGNERMSQQYRAQNIGKAGQALVGVGAGQGAADLFGATYGVGAGLTLLKYSRTHESEADKLGVVFMAMAGYDPEKSIEFWTRMSANGGGGGMQMLSTHPSDQKRIDDLKKFMPKAKSYFKK
ncbi:MAG: M48 family metallopeptidase [Bacteroidia bacterium]|nr:M48 family metallopeptidase [Bacteroidia bacterium]